MDSLLVSAATGPRFLSHPEIAATVVDAILRRERLHYEAHARVVMPNHVHLLITPLAEVSKVVQSLKRFKARE
jgi:REP element-mobilizing transposase RayT